MSGVRQYRYSLDDHLRDQDDDGEWMMVSDIKNILARIDGNNMALSISNLIEELQ